MVNSLEDIARQCHQRLKILCECHGDYSQKDWDGIESYQKESALNGVEFVITSYPFINAKKIHDNWVRHKTEEGWTYGPEKNAELKTHPNLVDYKYLKFHDMQKDLIFLETVLNMMCLPITERTREHA